ncbi:MAG: hypothetical protein KFH98_14395, partial [Gemmatimonadetes bacterium]|nr:hypothetical protein [Gemmatimonadota bacterium]
AECFAGGMMSLDNYAGDYITKGGYSARFRVIGTRLCLQLMDRSFIPLQPVGEAVFGVPFCVDFGVRFELRSNAVAGGILLMGNAEREFQRVKDRAGSPSNN